MHIITADFAEADRHNMQFVGDGKKYNSQLAGWYYTVIKQQPTWQSLSQKCKIKPKLR